MPGSIRPMDHSSRETGLAGDAPPKQGGTPPLRIGTVRNEAELAEALGILHQLRPDVPVAEMPRRIESMRSLNAYRLLVGVLAGVENRGRVVAVAGIRPDDGLSRGPHLRVDDLVVCKSHRGRGFGRAMLRGVADEARRLGLPKVLLDARHSARGFYERLGFAFREAEPCMIDVDAL